MLLVMSSKPNVWRSRIVGHDRVDPESLVANPNNFRKHPLEQRDALSAAISDVGFVRSVTVNKTTGNLVDGHERVWQALKSEQPLIDVEYVELSEDEERKVLATLDHIGSLGIVDDELLRQLLVDVESAEGDFSKILVEMAADLEVVDPDAPLEFPSFAEDIKTDHQCPKCGYEWS